MRWEDRAAANPNWKSAGKAHDWRNYISEPLREMWNTFHPYQRVAIILNAQKIADQEEWD